MPTTEQKFEQRNFGHLIKTERSHVFISTCNLLFIYLSSNLKGIKGKYRSL